MASKYINLTLDAIALPDPYIRKEINNQRINMWAETYRDKMKEILDKTPGLSNEDAAAKVWDHRPILVMELAKAETIIWKDKDGKKQLRLVTHRIIDGVHRYFTSRQLGRTTIACKVTETLPPTVVYMMQFTENNDGPLPFDRETRDQAIRYMIKDLEQTLGEVARHVRMSEAQVSRIATGKSGQSAAATSKARKAGAAKRKAKKAGGYDAKDFFTNLRVTAREAVSHRKALTEYLGEHDTEWSKAQDLINALTVLRGK